MQDKISHIKYHMKVRNSITSIAGNNADVYPLLISMEMFSEEVSKRVVNSTVPLGDIIPINSRIYHSWSLYYA